MKCEECKNFEKKQKEHPADELFKTLLEIFTQSGCNSDWSCFGCPFKALTNDSRGCSTFFRQDVKGMEGWKRFG